MEELTREQLEFFHQKLLSLKEETLVDLKSLQISVKPVDLDIPIGRISRIDAIQQQRMSQARERQLKIQLQQIKRALISFEEEEYGYCRHCDGLIAYKRLMAYPEVPFCLDCQSEIEKRG